MAGYNYYEGMSNNALDAYENGIKPLSKITALDLKLAGWTGTKADAMRLAKSEFWKSCEWHHSGGSWYNSVDFYNPADLVDSWGSASSAERIDALKTEEPKLEEKKCAGNTQFGAAPANGLERSAASRLWAHSKTIGYF